MLCEKCKQRVGQDVISFGKCKLCGKQTYSGTSPAPTLCPECSREAGLCEICGTSLWEQMTFDDLGVDQNNN